MSLVNSAGERIYLAPKPMPFQPVRSAKIRARNRRWLQVQRKLGLTLREVAELVGRPRATVANGLRWAEVEEERLEATEIAAERPPVLHEASGLDIDDLCYLVGEYRPGTEAGDMACVRDFFARMVDRTEAMGYDVRPLRIAMAGAA